jgi:hypothetical protein
VGKMLLVMMTCILLGILLTFGDIIHPREIIGLIVIFVILAIGEIIFSLKAPETGLNNVFLFFMECDLYITITSVISLFMIKIIRYLKKIIIK